MLDWRKPEFICIKTADMMCKIKAKAYSNYETICSTDQANAWCTGTDLQNLGGSDGEFYCGVVHQCIVGPGDAMGCDVDFYCSVIVWGM